MGRGVTMPAVERRRGVAILTFLAALVGFATPSASAQARVATAGARVVLAAGFPWAALGVAIAVVLFIGGFAGNMLSTRRARARPSVYAIVQRRLEEERARGKAPGAAANGSDAPEHQP